MQYHCTVRSRCTFLHQKRLNLIQKGQNERRYSWADMKKAYLHWKITKKKWVYNFYLGRCLRATFKLDISWNIRPSPWVFKIPKLKFGHSSLLHELFVTSSILIPDLFLTCLHLLLALCTLMPNQSWPVHDLLMTCSWLAHDLFTTSFWIGHNLEVLKLVHHLLVTFSWLFYFLFICFAWLKNGLILFFYFLFITCSQLLWGTNIHHFPPYTIHPP